MIECMYVCMYVCMIGVELEILDTPPHMASIASPYRNLITVEAISVDGAYACVTGMYVCMY